MDPPGLVKYRNVPYKNSPMGPAAGRTDKQCQCTSETREIAQRSPFFRLPGKLVWDIRILHASCLLIVEMRLRIGRIIDSQLSND